MVLLSGHGEQLAGERVCPAPAAAKEMPGAEAESSPEQGTEGAAAEGPGEEDEEEEEEDCEEYEDFSELPDTCSIASDDSFYPPRGLDDDDEDTWSQDGDERDSPEALSLFRACCTNNSIVLKALIRQGPGEEEVREADRNRRPRGARDPKQRGAEKGVKLRLASHEFPPLAKEGPVYGMRERLRFEFCRDQFGTGFCFPTVYRGPRVAGEFEDPADMPIQYISSVPELEPKSNPDIVRGFGLQLAAEVR
ncbi:hypothetical protein BTVI_137007 [Pitangus sulphuratus]|nr:hypothetical protein BTVI_137007 [Pitangus sulphuratus]